MTSSRVGGPISAGFGGLRLKFVDLPPALEDMRRRTLYVLKDETAGYLRRREPVVIAGTATSREWDSADPDDYLGDFATDPSSSPAGNANRARFTPEAVSPMDDFPSAGRRYRGRAAGISSAIQLMERQGDWCTVDNTVFQYLDGVSAIQSSLIPGLSWGATRSSAADVIAWLEGLGVQHDDTDEASDRPVYMYWTGSAVRRVTDLVVGQRIYYYNTTEGVSGFQTALYDGSWQDTDTVPGVTVMADTGNSAARYDSATQAVDTYFEDGGRAFDSTVTYVFYNATSGNVESIDTYTPPSTRYEPIRVELDFREGLVFVDEQPALEDMKTRTWYIIRDGSVAYLKRLDSDGVAYTATSTPWDSADPDDYLGDFAAAPSTSPSDNANEGELRGFFIYIAENLPSEGFNYKAIYASEADLLAGLDTNGDWAVFASGSTSEIYYRELGLTREGVAPPGVVWGGTRANADELHEWFEGLDPTPEPSTDIGNLPLYLYYDETGSGVRRVVEYEPRGRLYYYDTTDGTGGFRTALYGSTWVDTDTFEGDVVVMSDPDAAPDARYAKPEEAGKTYFGDGDRYYDPDLTYVYFDENEGGVEQVTAYSATPHFDDALVSIPFSGLEFVESEPALADMENRTWYILEDETAGYLKRLNPVEVARTAASMPWDSVDPDDYLGDFGTAPSTSPTGNDNEGALGTLAYTTTGDGIPSTGYSFKGLDTDLDDLEALLVNDGDWGFHETASAPEIYTNVEGEIIRGRAPEGVVWMGQTPVGAVNLYRLIESLDDSPDSIGGLAERPQYLFSTFGGNLWRALNYTPRGRLYYYDTDDVGAGTGAGFRTALYGGTWEDTSTVEGVVVMSEAGNPDARYADLETAVDTYFRDGGWRYGSDLTYVYYDEAEANVEVVSAYTPAYTRYDEILVTAAFSGIEFVETQPALADMEVRKWYILEDETAAYLKRLDPMTTARTVSSMPWDSVDPDDYLGDHATAPSTSPASNDNDGGTSSYVLSPENNFPSTGYRYRGQYASIADLGAALTNSGDWGILTTNGGIYLNVPGSLVEQAPPGVIWGGSLGHSQSDEVFEWLEGLGVESIESDTSSRPVYAFWTGASVARLSGYTPRGRIYYYDTTVVPAGTGAGFQTTIYGGTWEDTDTVEGVVVMTDADNRYARYADLTTAADTYFRDGDREYDSTLTYVYYDEGEGNVEVLTAYSPAVTTYDDVLVTINFSGIEFVADQPDLADMDVRKWYIREDETAAYLKRVDEVPVARTAESSGWDSVDPDDYLGDFAAAPSTSPSSNDNDTAGAVFQGYSDARDNYPSADYSFKGQFDDLDDLNAAIPNEGDWAVFGDTTDATVVPQIFTQQSGIQGGTAPAGIVWLGRMLPDVATLVARLATLVDPPDSIVEDNIPQYLYWSSFGVGRIFSYTAPGRIYYYNSFTGLFQTALYGDPAWVVADEVEGVTVMGRLDTANDAQYDSAGEAVDAYIVNADREFDADATYIFFNAVSSDVEVIDSYTPAGTEEVDTLVTLDFANRINFVDQQPALVDMELQTWYILTDESAAYLKRVDEVFTPRSSASSAWDSVDPDDYLGAFATAPSTSPAGNNNAPADARFTSAILAAGTEKPSSYVFRGVFASAGAFNVAIVAGDPTDWGLLTNGDLTVEVGALSSSIEESIPGMEWGGELTTDAAVLTWLAANWQNDGRLYAYRRTVSGTQNVYEVSSYTPESQSEFTTSSLASGTQSPTGYVFRGNFTSTTDFQNALVLGDPPDWGILGSGALVLEVSGGISNPTSILGMEYGDLLATDAEVRTWLDANWQNDGRLYAFWRIVSGIRTTFRVDSYTPGIAQTIYYYDTAQGRYFSAPYGGEWAVTPTWPDITIMYEADDGSANDSSYATLDTAVQTYFEAFEDGIGRTFDATVTYVFYNQATSVLEQVDSYAAAFTTFTDTLVTLGTGGLTLGPPTNEFNAATRAAAETARDDYATANPLWLPQYDAEPTFTIVLSWPVIPTDTIYQSRRSSVWADVTGLVRGAKGDLGAQGRFLVYAYVNSVNAPASTPVGGTFTRNTGALTVPSGYTAVPSTPPSGSKTWRVEAVVNAFTDPNVVSLVWSAPFELPAYAAAALAAGSATAAAASATAAAGSATAAAGSASGVAASATAAAGSATAAASSATQADTAAGRAETAETNAETAQTGAESARTQAQTARTGAQTAQSGAETAETDAGTAQTGAETAQTGAEAARDAAQGYAAQAQGQAGLLTSYTGPARILDPVAYESTPTDITVPSWRAYDELIFVFQDSGGTVGHLSAPVLVDVLDTLGQTESGQQQNDRLTLIRTDGSDVLSVGLTGWSGHPAAGDTIAVWALRSGVTAGGPGGGASAFSELTGQIADNQVPDTFTRDSELRFFPCATSGSGDALVLTTGRSLTALVDGMAFYFITGLTNAGAVTADVDGIGAKQLRVAVRTISGTLNFQELGANQITPNMPLLAFYNTTLDRLYLQQLPPGDVHTRFTGTVEGSVPLVGIRDELALSVIPAAVARLAGAIFTGETGGVTPVNNSDFTTKEYVDAAVAGTTPPSVRSELIYYGRILAANAADVAAARTFAVTIDVSTLDMADATVAGHNITIGPSADGDFFLILVPGAHDLLTLVNQGTQADARGAYSRFTNVRNDLGTPTEQYNAYILGPLNPGVTISYHLTLAE